MANTNRKIPDPELISLEAAALMLDVSRRTVERIIAAGEISVVRIRGSVKLQKQDVRNLCRRRERRSRQRAAAN